jgi:hypothetical protein
MNMLPSSVGVVLIATSSWRLQGIITPAVRDRRLKFLHFSRGAGRGESAFREFEIGNL